MSDYVFRNHLKYTVRSALKFLYRYRMVKEKRAVPKIKIWKLYMYYKLTFAKQSKTNLCVNTIHIDN